MSPALQDALLLAEQVRAGEQLAHLRGEPSTLKLLVIALAMHRLGHACKAFTNTIRLDDGVELMVCAMEISTVPGSTTGNLMVSLEGETGQGPELLDAALDRFLADRGIQRQCRRAPALGWEELTENQFSGTAVAAFAARQADRLASQVQAHRLEEATPSAAPPRPAHRL